MPDLNLPAHLPPEIAEAVKTAQQYGPPGGYGMSQGRDYPPPNHRGYQQNEYDYRGNGPPRHGSAQFTFD